MGDDLYRQLETRLVQLIQEFNEYRNTNPLEKGSVRKGRLRFIGGVLLIDSGGRLEIVGVLDGNGTFHWTGPWKFDSVDGGEIAGDVLLSGNFDLLGKFETDGIRIQDGKIYVGIGGTQIVIDGATGKITAGNVTIESNKITVAGGLSPATLQDGKMSFGTGGTVEADTGVGGARMTAGDAVVNVGSTASIRKGSSSVIVGALGIDINPAGDGDIDLLGTAHFDRTTIPQVSGTGLPIDALLISSSGYLQRADGT